MKKIAVMLPLGYRGGSLRGAKSIAKSIAMMARREGDDIQVVFSYLTAGNYDLYSDFNDLKEYGISLRETTWKLFSRDTLQATLPLLDIDPAILVSDQYCLPADGANDFFDCDLWVVVSDRLPAPLFPLRKYACVIYDYIQRYVPEIWGEGLNWQIQEQTFFPLLRNAARVFVTTPSTRADMVAYAGVNTSQIALMEMDFEPPVPNHKDDRFDLDLPARYFVWETNPIFHKNHVHALDALAIYYQELGGKFDLLITGSGSEYLDPEREFDPGDLVMQMPQIQLARQMIKTNPSLRGHLQILGHIPEKLLSHVLKHARFLWHPARYDNGTFSVIEAAYFHHPSVSARYPAMEYIDRSFDLNLSFVNPHDPHEIAKALLDMQKNYHTIELPQRKSLLARSWQAHAPALYREIRELL